MAARRTRSGRGGRPVLLRRAGAPTVKLGARGLKVSRLPAGLAAVELTLYRVTKVDGAPSRKRVKLRAAVKGGGTTLKLASRPPVPR